MEDIAPELLKKIQSDFDEAIEKSEILKRLAEKIEAGTATYVEANDYAIEVGNILSDAYRHNLSSAVLPDGKMYYNIANRIITETMKRNYDLVSEVSEQIQALLNEAAGIGIKAIQPELNSDRITGIANRLSTADNFDEVSWILGEPVVNFSQSVVDDFIKVNSEFHGKCGMEPKIVRKLAGGCCEWCREIAGTYSYSEVPNDVYRRHQRCRCTVDYYPGDGKIQNVHSKQWQTKAERDKIEKRKRVAQVQPKIRRAELEKKIEEETGLAFQLSEHPMMFRAYTPKGLKKALENAGYNVKTLSKGKYKGIPFENGGGFKVNFGGDGILQYHPEKGSHHGGAYYKISTGKGGIHHYELDGTEKRDVSKDKGEDK